MTKANRVHSTPRRTASATRPIDAYSMSPAIRLRYRILAEKTSARALLPPPVGEEAHGYYSDADAVNDAFADNHSLATLIRLRAEAAKTIEHLLIFLDDSDGLIDDEDVDEDGDLAGSVGDVEEDRADFEPTLGMPEIAEAAYDPWSEYGYPYFAHQGDQTRGFGNADDLEQGDDDEPSLCGINASAVASPGVVEDGEDNSDDEPSLGWPECTMRKCVGDSDDRELDAG